MAWLQLHLATTEAHADAFQSALEDMGACAVTLTDGADQPVFEPPPGARPLWQNIVVSALFDADRDPALILAALQQQGLDAQAHHHETLDDQVWERAWMDDFAPMRFGERLWIVPSWSESPDPQAVNLKLDPGLAFGTGTHETTALCLEWLDRADLHGKTVLDFGCGSGVLAIAALLLGAGNATGTDIDPRHSPPARIMPAITVWPTGSASTCRKICRRITAVMYWSPISWPAPWWNWPTSLPVIVAPGPALPCPAFLPSRQNRYAAPMPPGST